MGGQFCLMMTLAWKPVGKGASVTGTARTRRIGGFTPPITATRRLRSPLSVRARCQSCACMDSPSLRASPWMTTSRGLACRSCRIWDHPRLKASIVKARFTKPGPAEAAARQTSASPSSTASSRAKHAASEALQSRALTCAWPGVKVPSYSVLTTGVPRPRDRRVFVATPAGSRAGLMVARTEPMTRSSWASETAPWQRMRGWFDWHAFPAQVQAEVFTEPRTWSLCGPSSSGSTCLTNHSMPALLAALV
mmetsp:Transcript_23209/g.73041  ORF Transcript_23209/g.73041 Transcript_23209/m.73041 type:complete len:250 (+) Transcript_23209:1427-2176(+)